jgi:hypothetical protein
MRLKAKITTTFDVGMRAPLLVRLGYRFSHMIGMTLEIHICSIGYRIICPSKLKLHTSLLLAVVCNMVLRMAESLTTIFSRLDGRVVKGFVIITARREHSSSPNHLLLDLCAI